MTSAQPQSFIGPFQIIALLGQGESSRVYEAIDPATTRRVVLKVALRSEPLVEAQFRQEFNHATRVRHPNLREALDHGVTATGTPYLVLAHHPGATLAAKAGPQPPALVARWARQLAAALAALHAEGLVYRDLSPSNVLLEPGGQARLLDFGLVAQAPAVGCPGDPRWMAPEALRGEPVDARGDLYALGAVMYALLAGQPPFGGDDPTALVAAVCAEAPRPLPEVVPPPLATLVMRLLGKAPADRPASAREVGRALELVAGREAPILAEGTFVPPPDWGAWCSQLGVAGGFAWVGEAGSGRTRCIHEAYALLRRQGRPALLLTGEPGSGPYTLLEQLWRWAVARAPEAAAAVPRPLMRLMASLWPWSFPEAVPLDEPARLARVLPELLRQLLAAAMAGHRPMVLVDGWEHVDEVSRTILLDGLAGSLREWHLLVASQAPVRGLTAYALPAFDAARTATWLASVLPEAPPEGWASRLCQVAGGNPGWMAQALPQMLAADDPTAAVPGSVDTVLGATWRALTVGQRTIMTVIALQGGACTTEEWRAVSANLAPDWPLEREALVARRLLVEGAGRLRLALGWWVDWILEREPAARLAHLSSELARALASLPAAQLVPVPPALAHRIARLAVRGDDRSLALRWSSLAAEAAARVWAYEVALGHARAGLAAAAGLGLGGEGNLATVGLRGIEADALRVLGRLGEAIELYEAITPHAPDRTTRGRWLTSTGKCHQMSSRLPEALAAYDQAIGVLSEAGAYAECARARAAIGRAQFMAGERGASEAAYRLALHEARQAGHVAIEAEALAFLGNLAVEAPGTCAEGLAALEQALQLQIRDGRPFSRIDTQSLLGNALLTLGRPREARPHFAACRELSMEVGNLQDAGLACLNLALCDVEQGRWHRAASWLEEAERLALQSDYPLLGGFASAADGLVRTMMGDTEAAQAAVATSREREARLGVPYLRQFGLVFEAWRHLWLGAFDQARRAAQLALELVARAGGGEWEFRAQAVLVEACLLSRDTKAGTAALERLQAMAVGRGDGLRVVVARLEGVQAYVAQEPEAAREAWEEARRLARLEELAGLEIELGTLLCLLARELGPGVSVLADLDRALGLAEGLGAPVPLGLVHLALAAHHHAAGDEVRAERLVRQGHVLLGSGTRDLPSGAARQQFLAHPLRKPWCEGEGLEQTHVLLQRTRRLEMLVSLGQALGVSQEPDAVLQRVTAFTQELTRAERCLVLLAEPTGTGWRVWGEAAAEAYSRTVVAQAARERKSVAVLDTLSDQDLNLKRSIEELRLRSVVCVPMLAGSTLHGVLYVDSQLSLGAFGPDDVRVLEAIAAQAAFALDTARMVQALRSQMEQQAAHLRLLAEKDTTITALRDYDRARQAAFESESHDLKAPLASILVAAQSLHKELDGPLTPLQAETVEGLLLNTRALMTRIDGILDAASLEAGRLSLHVATIRLQDVVADALRQLAPVAEARRLSLTAPIDAWRALPPVRGDARRLALVVQNLLDNALKYTTSGGIHLTLGVAERGVRLTIQDSGPGLPPERRAAPFQRYGGRDPDQPGSGLGLWRTAALVEQHGGTIEVTCPDGGGTRVEVTLPRA
ncbi:MAG: ATP-binding protein [Candidatus Sericytochromatia bacterium]|nr:ATP-binding protein [Candidatus Sericytochromatia bacterium]